MNKYRVSSLWIGKDLTKIEQLCIKSFLKNGYEFELYTYAPLKGIPEGTTVKDGNEIIPKSEIFQYKNGSYSAFSNIFRFTMLYKKGGHWVDMDLVCVKRYEGDEKYVIPSETDKKYIAKKFSAGILRFPKGCPIMKEAMDFCNSKREAILDGSFEWGLGPLTLKHIIEKFNLQDFIKPWYFSTSCNNKHFKTLFDINYDPRKDTSVKGYELKYFNNMKDIPEGCYFIHLSNHFFVQQGVDKDQTFHKDSFIEQLKRKYFYEEKKNLSIVIALKNRTSIIADYEKIPLRVLLRHDLTKTYFKKKINYTNEKPHRIRLNLLLNCLESLQSLETDINFEVVIVDFLSDDYNLNLLPGKYNKLNIKIIQTNEKYFSRGRGLNIGYRNCTYDNIFFCDADMEFKSDLVFQKGLRYLKVNKVFFPICFNFVEPSHQFGYFRNSGYGLNFVKKEMLNDYEWVEYDTYGKEDNDFWKYFWDKMMIAREEVKDYYHQWHSENLEFKIKYWRNNDINNQKNRKKMKDVFKEEKENERKKLEQEIEEERQRIINKTFIQTENIDESDKSDERDERNNSDNNDNSEDNELLLMQKEIEKEKQRIKNRELKKKKIKKEKIQLKIKKEKKELSMIEMEIEKEKQRVSIKNNKNQKLIFIDKLDYEKKEKIKNLINFLPKYKNIEYVDDLNKKDYIEITSKKVNNKRYKDTNDLILRLHNLAYN